MNIKRLEQEVVKAERKANAPFLHDAERARREAVVAELQADLDAAYAAAEGELVGNGRRGRSRW